MNIQMYLCSETGNLTKEQISVLAPICPKAFKGLKPKKGWKYALKRTKLEIAERELLKSATEKGRIRTGKERAWRGMFTRARIESRAVNPHEKFCKIIGTYEGVRVTDIKIKDNNDTTIDFFYKGNNISATCYGSPLTDGGKFLPTEITVNGVKKDVTGIDMRDVLSVMPQRKRFVYKAKG